MLVLSSNKRRSHIYHTTDCQIVEGEGRDEMVYRDAERMSDKWRECQHCSGEYDPSECSRSEFECPLCDDETTVQSLPAHLAAEHDGGDI